MCRQTYKRLQQINVPLHWKQILTKKIEKSVCYSNLKVSHLFDKYLHSWRSVNGREFHLMLTVTFLAEPGFIFLFCLMICVTQILVFEPVLKFVFLFVTLQLYKPVFTSASLAPSPFMFMQREWVNNHLQSSIYICTKISSAI